MSAIEFIARFSVDHAIISAGAVDPSGILDYALDEAEFARTVLSRGRRKLVVTDSSKFTRAGLIQVCAFGDISELVTDAAPPSEIAEAVRAADARLTIVS
jgi:DeoR family glycerol-3-phosphate regulon repressor